MNLFVRAFEAGTNLGDSPTGVFDAGIDGCIFVKERHCAGASSGGHDGSGGD